MAKHSAKRRLDAELVEQGFFETTQEAMRAVMEGRVSSGGERLVHAGSMVVSGIPLHVKQTKTSGLGFVGRGGIKLQGALDSFGISPLHKTCLDVGCSTGGFTDCLLQNNASKVVAVDVGYGQFDWSLRNNPKVLLLERTNICNVMPEDIGGLCDLVVADVSFTSIDHILEAVIRLMKPQSELCSLVKPQFEANSNEVGEGGIVRDPAVHKRILAEVVQTCLEAGLDVRGLCVSPITGAKGNTEFFIYATRGFVCNQESVEDLIARVIPNDIRENQ